jgi:regulator of sigma E protease
MLGGVTVNLVLGFLIYMMILFVWGKNTLPNSSLPLGLGAFPLAKEIGFQIGDQILKVDGNAIEVATEINKMLFMRSVKEVEVLHTDGSREILAIPEDIGSRMFESGQMNLLYPRFPAIVDSVVPGHGAALSGLLAGDIIIGANDAKISDWMELKQWNIDHSNENINLIIERNNRLDTLKMDLDEDGKMGVFPKNSIRLKHVDLSLGESIVEGFDYGYWTLHDYVAQFKYVFTKKGASQMGGFGAIGSLFPETWNWKGFWSSTALISIILAFMNLLPIPALDGGHVMFLLYEMISGRKPNEKFMEYAQMMGFFLILALVLYANGNDIYRAFIS